MWTSLVSSCLGFSVFSEFVCLLLSADYGSFQSLFFQIGSQSLTLSLLPFFYQYHADIVRLYVVPRSSLFLILSFCSASIECSATLSLSCSFNILHHLTYYWFLLVYIFFISDIAFFIYDWFFSMVSLICLCFLCSY